MNYKLQGAIRKSKKYFIIYAVLWLILSIVLVAPMAYATQHSIVNGAFNIGTFIAESAGGIASLGKTLSEFPNYIGSFFDVLFKFTIFYLIFVIIGVAKARPKNEYTDIEHGSSDWCKNGEQYRILDNKKGIILAQDNYLPVDKRGNVNVLVVGRFRFW